MKFLHIADLHFGKSLHEVSLVEEDQPYWVEQFLSLVDRTKPDAVVIAGDVYDRAAPSGEAFELLSYLFTALSARGIKTMVCSGNHDSGQKLGYASQLLKNSNIYIAGMPSTEIERIELEDEFGKVDFFLMPYLFPAAVNQLLGRDDLHDSDAAIRAYLDAQEIDQSRRNIIVAHQNVICSGVKNTLGGSETIIGGVGGVDYTAFDAFDYVALGHIHAAQAVGRDSVRYCGTPLCYHFSETTQPVKGPLLVELGAKGTPPEITLCPLPALHPMRKISGSYADIVSTESSSAVRDEYISVDITDRRLDPVCSDTLRAIFDSRNCRMLEISSSFSQHAGASASSGRLAEARPLDELFADFFTRSNGGTPPDDLQLDFIKLAARQTNKDGNTDKDFKISEKDIDELEAFIKSSVK